jgi:hypothetical protein
MNGRKINIGERWGTFTVVHTEKDIKNKTLYVLKCDCGSEKKCIGYFVRKKRKCQFCHVFNLIGTKNHKTTFLKYIGHSTYECLCDCGKKFIGKDRRKSCGCHVEESHILEAKKLNGITPNGIIVNFIRFDFRSDNKSRVSIFQGKCKCGKLFEIKRSNLLKVKSCGCRKNCSYSQGEKHYNAKLSKNDVVSLIELYLSGMYTEKELCSLFNAHSSVVKGIIQRKSWKSIVIPEKVLKNSKLRNKIGFIRKYDPVKIGDRYGEWVVLEKTDSRNDRTCYLCKCKCDHIYSVYGTSLKMGESTRCRICQKDWCKKYDYKSYVGKKLGSKIVLDYFMEGKVHRFKIRCDCGYENISTAGYIVRNPKNHCEKCYSRESRRKKK